MIRQLGRPGALGVFVVLLAAGIGCDNSKNLSTTCVSSSNCNAAQGYVCCDGQCAQAASCAACASPPMDVTGDWQWEYICKDVSGSCPVRTVSTTMTIASSGVAVTVTPAGEDPLGGSVCNDTVSWAEAVVGGSDIGCFTFNAAVDQFNQRSWADNGNRLCAGVGARVGTALPPIPTCADLTGNFFVCPAAPPAAP